jgi:hypothetical protein
MQRTQVQNCCPACMSALDCETAFAPDRARLHAPCRPALLDRNFTHAQASSVPASSSIAKSSTTVSRLARRALDKQCRLRLYCAARTSDALYVQRIVQQLFTTLFQCVLHGHSAFLLLVGNCVCTCGDSRSKA